MSTLLLRLSAPMQSWGGPESKFNFRLTQREPTKSGVVGILAAALGMQRDDEETLRKLSRMRFGVRVDREGKKIKDYHIAQAEKPYVTYRYYLCDAVFLCGLESDDRETLEQYAYALTHPVYPLFLGRRSCPPDLPLVRGIRDCDLETALRGEPWPDEKTDSMRMILDAEPWDRNTAMVKDVPASFSPRRREFSYRNYREFMIRKSEQTKSGHSEQTKNGHIEHDPFAEVEAENVSNAAGT